jgi:hypothetical protein
MPYYVIFKTSTGGIVRSGFAPTEADAAAQAGEGEDYILTERQISDSEYWVSDVQNKTLTALLDPGIAPDKLTVTADEQDIVTFSGVAQGTVIVIDGVRDEFGNPGGTLLMHNDATGLLELSFDCAAGWRVGFSRGSAYKSVEFLVTSEWPA